MSDLAGYKIRELAFDVSDKPMWTKLADGDTVFIGEFDDGSISVERQGLWVDHYHVATKEMAIQLCNEWQREAVHQLLEKT